MDRNALLLAAPQGHPFRRSVMRDVKVSAARAQDQDWKLFLLSFAAFFICFYTFIA
jgi:hypothetical protein